MDRSKDTDLREALCRREQKRHAVEVPEDFTERLMQRIGQQGAKPRHRRVWLYAGLGAVAATFLLFVVLHYNYSNVEHLQRADTGLVPTVAQQLADHVAQEAQPRSDEMIKSQQKTRKASSDARSSQTAKSAEQMQADTMPAENIEYYIARLEAEMDALDDSVNAAHMQQLIAADARLQQLVSRIVGKQAQQALNEILNDSTANYIHF